MKLNDEINKAFELAKEVRLRAHAPYSNFLVGTAIKLKDSDDIFSGCNVENISYGATICAERVCTQNIVATKGKVPFEFMVVVTQTEEPTSCCGMCLQVLSEFVDADFPIYFGNLKEIKFCKSFSELFPTVISTLKD